MLGKYFSQSMWERDPNELPAACTCFCEANLPSQLKTVESLLTAHGVGRARCQHGGHHPEHFYCLGIKDRVSRTEAIRKLQVLTV